MQHFFLKLIAPRPTFPMDMSPEEKAMMGEHLAYWKAKLANGDVVVFGPVMDPNGPYGVAIVAAPDEAAARAFTDADPAIQSKRGFVYEIYPMRAVTRETTKA